MSEISKSLKVLTAATALTLGVSACSASTSEKPEAKSAPTQADTTVVRHLANGAIKVTYDLAHGTRIIDNYDYVRSKTGGDDGTNAPFFMQWCDGTSLYSETVGLDGRGAGAPAIENNAAVCADYKLTPSDFPGETN